MHWNGGKRIGPLWARNGVMYIWRGGTKRPKPFLAGSGRIPLAQRNPNFWQGGCWVALEGWVTLDVVTRGRAPFWEPQRRSRVKTPYFGDIMGL